MSEVLSDVVTRAPGTQPPFGAAKAGTVACGAPYEYSSRRDAIVFATSDFDFS